MRVLDVDQARRFLVAVRKDAYYALYALALTGGLRRRELLTLRWQDIDWSAGVLHIRQFVRRSQGSVIVSGPKSESGRRTIILLPLAMESLKEHRQPT